MRVLSSKDLPRIALGVLVALSMSGCGSEDESNLSSQGTSSSTVAAINATSAVITQGDNFSQTYTTTLTARAATGGAATLEQSKLAPIVFGDVPSTKTFALSSTAAAGQYTPRGLHHGRRHRVAGGRVRPALGPG
jgi:hypothetical protein